MNKGLKLPLLILLTLSRLAESCQDAEDYICNTGRLSRLCEAITTAGLGDELDTGSWTIFAPVNSAFEEFDDDFWDAILGDQNLLTNLMLFHAVKDEVIPSDDLECRALVRMANGKDTRTICEGDDLFQKGGANQDDDKPRLISTDIPTCQGFIHVVNEVLLFSLFDFQHPTANPAPHPTMPPAPHPSEDPSEGPSNEPTVAPIHPTPHPSDEPTADPIHPTPHPTTSPPTDPPTTAPVSTCRTLLDLVCGSADLTTLCRGIRRAGLENALDNPNSRITLFAPLNDGFDELEPGLLSYISSDDDLLESVLLFHAVGGSVLLTRDLGCSDPLRMFNGYDSRTVCSGPDKFQKGGGNPRSDMPRIVQSDIGACNGVLHIVDEVMLPYNIQAPPAGPSPTPKPTPSPATPAPIDPTIAPVVTPTDAPQTPPPHPGCSTIVELICSRTNFSTLCRAIREAGVEDALNNASGLTVFAPNNAAFQELGPAVLNYLSNTPSVLRDVLQFHATATRFTVGGLSCSDTIQMLNGYDSRTVCNTLGKFQKGGGNPRSDMPLIINGDNEACNDSIIHVVDEVLLPYAIVVGPSPPVVTPTTPAPVPAPTTPAPVPPPTTPAPVPPPTKHPPTQCDGSIVDLICDDHDLTLLCDALHQTGLDVALDQDGPWVIFAPTDHALNGLGHLSLTQRRNLLLFHVAEGPAPLVCAELVNMVNGADTRTVCSGAHTFQKGGGNPRSDMPKIVGLNRMACNGVIHVIDGVLRP